MKVVAKPIEVVAWFGEDGKVHPVRFRMKDENESLRVIIINRIIKRDTEKLVGNIMEKFTCSSVINGTEKLFEIKYDKGTCKWVLFKI